MIYLITQPCAEQRGRPTSTSQVGTEHPRHLALTLLLCVIDFSKVPFPQEPSPVAATQAYLGPTASSQPSQIHAHNQIFYKDVLKQTSAGPLAFTKTHRSTKSIQGSSQTRFSLSTLQPEPQSSWLVEGCGVAAWAIALGLCCKPEPRGFVSHTARESHKGRTGLSREA